MTELAPESYEVLRREGLKIEKCGGGEVALNFGDRGVPSPHFPDDQDVRANPVAYHF